METRVEWFTRIPRFVWLFRSWRMLRVTRKHIIQASEFDSRFTGVYRLHDQGVEAVSTSETSTRLDGAISLKFVIVILAAMRT
jgi:hypothetical protein